MLWLPMAALTALGMRLKVEFAILMQVVIISYDSSLIDNINWQLLSVHCTWTAWGSWKACSKTCCRGTKRRTRSKNGPYRGGCDCSGSSSEDKACNTHCCPSKEERYCCGLWVPVLSGLKCTSYCTRCLC